MLGHLPVVDADRLPLFGGDIADANGVLLSRMVR
jgi:hypothetical protein